MENNKVVPGRTLAIIVMMIQAVASIVAASMLFQKGFFGLGLLVIIEMFFIMIVVPNAIKSNAFAITLSLYGILGVIIKLLKFNLLGIFFSGVYIYHGYHAYESKSNLIGEEEKE
ncbi:hypothetical protein RJG79_01660 [Mycoplasmatota bacterium WC44]